MKYWLSGKLAQADKFGRSYDLHYKGDTFYKTSFGGCITIIIYVLVAINAVKIFSDFINDENEREVNRVISANLKELGDFNIEDN